MVRYSLNDVERLLNELKSDRASRREKAAQEIKELDVRDEQVIAALKQMLETETNKFTRAQAEEALAAITVEPGSIVAVPTPGLRLPESSSKPSSTGWRCIQCGYERDQPPLSNHCHRCNTATVPSRLTPDQYPVLDEPAELHCFAPRTKTVVLNQVEPSAEVLLVIGPGDMLPIVAETDATYTVVIPGPEHGYVQKAAGAKLLLGLGSVESPLGYVRLDEKPVHASTVALLQPDDKWEVIHTLKPEDRLPIVEERENAFKVQLPNGLRGWVNKANLIRTLRPESLPAQEGFDWGAALGLAAVVGLALVGGAIASDSQENRVRRGVERALRDRGL